MFILLIFYVVLALCYMLLFREFGIRLVARPPFLALGEPRRFGSRLVENLTRAELRRKDSFRDLFGYREGDPVKPSDRRRTQVMILGSFALIAVINLVNLLIG